MNNVTAAPSTLAESLASLERLRTMWSGVLVSHGWLVYFPKGLFIAADIDAGNVVRSVRSVGIPGATHFTERDAYEICRDGNLRNGAGEIAEPIHRLDALDMVIGRIRETIAAMGGL
jgi:hypothetical protein